MVASATWLRQVADKYNITGIDRRVVDDCANKIENYEAALHDIGVSATRARIYGAVPADEIPRRMADQTP